MMNKEDLIVVKNSNIVLTGKRNLSDGLWDIPISNDNTTSNPTSSQSIPKQISSLAVIIRKNQTHLDLVKYLHASCFSPVKSTFLRAIKNNHFTTWPGLTPQLVNKCLPAIIATELGHLNQQKQGLQSTKNQSDHHVQVKLEDHMTDAFPTPNSPNLKTNEVVYSLTTLSHKNKAFLDLTGRFPYQSSRGNNYILIGYHFDSNAILVEPLKNRQAAEITRGWKNINKKCNHAGVQPHTYVLDNEVSAEFILALKKYDIDFQLVPPHIHRANLAERAIQTFKHHFKAGLATVDPDFPLAEWDRLLPQAVLTLNLLRSARSNPKLSAHAYLFGEFNFSATPLAPPGTKVVMHKQVNNRTSWGPHGKEAWYIGPSFDHYRCVKCFVTDTRKELDSDTVVFFPKHIKFPAVTTDDFLRQAALDIVSILTNPPPATVPMLQAGDDTRNALLEIASTLKRITKYPSLPSTVSPIPTIPSQRTVPSSPPSAVPKTTTVEPPTSALLPTPPQPLDVTIPPTPSPRVLPPASLPRVAKKSTPPSLSQTKPQLKSGVPYIQQRYGLRSNKAYRPFSQNFRHRAAKHLLAQHLVQQKSPKQQVDKCMHIFDAAGKKQSAESLMAGDDAAIWQRSMSNELGRLAQGNIHGVKATDTIDFIPHRDVPHGQAVTYASFDINYRPLKTEKYRIRLVVGGDKLDYNGDSGSPAASLLETKVMINSVLSDAHKGARFMSCDLKDFFLATPMKNPEYMRINYKHFPQDIIDKYNLSSLVSGGYIYVKIKRGMYGLKQAAVLAYDHLIENLEQHGYTPVLHTLGIWKHKTRRTTFCLCVDDFGVKYFSKEDAQHLIDSLSQHYTCTTDWSGKNFCGLQIDWNYSKAYADISMPGYIEACLARFQHSKPSKPQHSPHHHNPVVFGPKGTRQYANKKDDSLYLDKKGTKYVQSVTGSLLYYARAIDSTILPALNEIASQQAKPTEYTMSKCKRLLDFVATFPAVYVRFYASDMLLKVDTDAAYLVMPKSRSRIAGYFYLGNAPTSVPHPKLNGAILIECKTLRHVVASAAEAEVGGIFHNAQTAIPIRNMLIAMGHAQPPTPIKTDNSTANSFVHDNINLKKSKSWDMRYYWLRDRSLQQQFKIFWEKGLNNLADYFTKHHATAHHRTTRSIYVQDILEKYIHSMAAIFQKYLLFK